MKDVWSSVTFYSRQCQTRLRLYYPSLPNFAPRRFSLSVNPAKKWKASGVGGANFASWKQGTAFKSREKTMLLPRLKFCFGKWRAREEIEGNNEKKQCFTAMFPILSKLLYNETGNFDETGNWRWDRKLDETGNNETGNFELTMDTEVSETCFPSSNVVSSYYYYFFVLLITKLVCSFRFPISKIWDLDSPRYQKQFIFAESTNSRL